MLRAKKCLMFKFTWLPMCRKSCIVISLERLQRRISSLKMLKAIQKYFKNMRQVSVEIIKGQHFILPH
jgi:hypothetical protein